MSSDRNSGIRTTGTYVPVVIQEDSVKAFVPDPLPPENPRMQFDADLQTLLGRANRAIGKLDGLASTRAQPDLDALIYAYTRKEAVLSSQIEGTQSSLNELLLFEHAEVPGVPIDDVRETSNYLAALEHSLQCVRSGQLPISARLIRDAHERLLKSSRGAERAPGVLRRSAVWVGGVRPRDARFIPPPWDRVPDLLGDLENYIHDDSEPTDPLIRAALVHVQFETIHPFLDGNGRVGRLLITLILCAEGLLAEPILYMSLYFKQHRDMYYETLQRVRTHGEWENWLRFFLIGVSDVSGQIIRTTERLVELREHDRATAFGLSRSSAVTGEVFDYFAKRIVASPKQLAERLGASPSSVNGALSRLEQAGIVNEVTGRKRNRLYAYGKYLEILNEDTEPLA